MRFLACVNRYCVDIRITDDNVLEPQESFTVSLERSEGIGNEIQREPDEMEIIIIDDDGMFVYCYCQWLVISALSSNHLSCT